MKDQLCCPVCLEVLRDPVTIPCGHSYCMDCIKGYWRKTEQKVGYTCPQCRRSFSPRPMLARNTLLAGLVEKLRDVGPRNSSPAECEACGGRKRRGAKSCAKCLSSHCEAHPKPHGERERGRPHKLQALRRACVQHRRPAELYCHTDQQLICSLCTADGHSGHRAVTAAEERAEKQVTVGLSAIASWRGGGQLITSLFSEHCTAVEEDSERICGKLLRSIERRHCELRELLHAEERTALAQAEGLLERLEEQVEEHRRKESELEQLAHTDDHVQFLQKCMALCGPAELEEVPSVDVHPYFSLIILRRALVELRERVNDVCDRELSRISKLSEFGIILKGENYRPKSNPPRLRNCFDVTLDPNTVNSYLCLSDGSRRVSATYESQHYPDHPERFATWAQVLGREGLSGHCYWEVEWGGSGGIAVGAAYKGITRHGGSADGRLGCNPKSWSLDLSDGLCTFQHNKTRIDTPTPISPRIGVYLDHKAGTLAFYCVSPRGDTMTLLHKVQTTFSQPLYPAFWVGQGSTLKLCPIFNFSA
uniref:Tripartite motif-containing protein 16-like n=1 Tax=Electrophorus electricus TaxID=8005 RepID=A0A4W4DX01_ELEEL